MDFIIISKVCLQTKENCWSITELSSDCSKWNEFEIVDVDNTFIVNLALRTCDYGIFWLSRIPCKQVALGIIYNRDMLENYYEEALKKDACLKTYAGVICLVTA